MKTKLRKFFQFLKMSGKSEQIIQIAVILTLVSLLCAFSIYIFYGEVSQRITTKGAKYDIGRVLSLSATVIPTAPPARTPTPKNMLSVTWMEDGPIAGNITTIAINPLTPSILFAGTSQDGILKSVNNGDNWTAIDISIDNPSIVCLTIDPKKTSTIYAATDNGLYKSTDGGETWDFINNSLTGLRISSLIIDPERPNILYAATYNGVFKSTNRGENWLPINNGLSIHNVFTIAVDPVVHTTLYAGTDYEGPPEDPNAILTGEESLFKSTNGGASWIAINANLPEHARVTSLAINPEDPETLYAWIAGNETGIYKSTNGGENWTLTSIGLTTYGNGVISLLIDPASSATLYAGTDHDGIFKSIDGGDTWNLVNTGLTGTHITTLAINPDSTNNLFAGVAGRGVFKSENSGENWLETHSIMQPAAISEILVDPRDPNTIIAGTKSNLFISTNGGTHWDVVDSPGISGQANTLVFDQSSSNILYVGIGKYIHVRDANLGWGIQMHRFDSDIHILTIVPGSPLYAGTSDGVFKQVNGETWSAVNNGLTNTNIMDLVIDPITVSTLFAGTNGGGVYKSTDSGENWVAVNNGLSNTSITDLAMDSQTPTTLYAATEGGIFKSTDGGGHWTEKNSGLSDLRIKVLAIYQKTSEILYAGTSTGQLYKSNNGGNLWMELNIDLTKSGFLTLAIDPLSADKLYVGTSSDGLIIIESGK